MTRAAPRSVSRLGRTCWRALFALFALCGPLGSAAAQDDRYRFAGQGARTVEATLVKTAGGVELTWPSAAGFDWDTALLGVRVRATDASAALELESGGARIAQFFEPEANGLRWLNLTSLKPRLKPGVIVAVHPRGAVLEAGAAALWLFRNRIDLDQPVLIVAPHPDDAEIAAFGVYTSARRASVLTVTAGNAGDAQYQAAFGNDVSAQYQWKGHLRALDSVTVPWQGGVPPERCFNLGYFDARLADMHGKPAEAVSEFYGPNEDVSIYRRVNLGRWLPRGPRTASWQHLVEDLLAVLRKLNPTLIAIPHPLLDSHLDHAFTAVAISEAVERWKRPVTFLLYTNHGAGDRYPFGPAGSVMALPPFSERELMAQGVFAFTLDAALQRKKLFALESMHDLRLSPTEQANCADPPAGKPEPPRGFGADYYRRALRSEETFLVADRAGLRALVADFLAGQTPARPAESSAESPHR